jgi:ketosteroid isomerase-like protein
MATIHREIEIQRSRESVWDAIRDVGAIHKRLVRGFVVDCKLQGDWREVTFANGFVARELIVDIDDKTFRHSWSAHSEPLTHHNASAQVFAEGDDRCRVVWIADVMPNEAAATMAGMIEQGLNAMKQTLEGESKTVPGRETAGSPDEICRLFQKYMREGDLDSVLTLYDPDAVLIDRTGETKRGAELRAVLAPLTAEQSSFDFEIKQIIQSGDIALMHTLWQVGSPPRPQHAIEVARRQTDGPWRWLIGDPFTVGTLTASRKASGS